MYIYILNYDHFFQRESFSDVAVGLFPKIYFEFLSYPKKSYRIDCHDRHKIYFVVLLSFMFSRRVAMATTSLGWQLMVRQAKEDASNFHR